MDGSGVRGWRVEGLVRLLTTPIRESDGWFGRHFYLGVTIASCGCVESGALPVGVEIMVSFERSDTISLYPPSRATDRAVKPS